MRAGLARCNSEQNEADLDVGAYTVGDHCTETRLASIETALALSELAPDHTDVTVIAPDAEFVYRPMAVREPAHLAGGQGFSSEITDTPTWSPPTKIAAKYAAAPKSCGSVSYTFPHTNPSLIQLLRDAAASL